MGHLIYGVGCNDLKGVVKSNTHPRKVWGSMLTRCYCEKYHKKYPSYVSVEVCKEWHIFSNFYDWYTKQKLTETKNITLDKDFLSEDRKVYSPKTCAFVPNYVNTLFSRCGQYYRHNLKCMLGVTSTGYSFEVYAYNKNDKKRKYMGAYKEELDAHRVWQECKIHQITDCIDEYRKTNLHNQRVEDRLLVIRDVVKSDYSRMKETKFIDP